jgi:proteasome accessory factor C
MKSLDKIYRLHEILKHARSYIPKEELLDKIGCSDSTLEKIIKELREIYNAPLEFNTHYSGYRYVYSDGERFELPGIWFSGDELAAWFSIYQIISDIPDGILSSSLSQVKSRIEKIASKVSLTPEKWAKVIKIIPMAYRKPHDIIFRVIVDGLIREKRINISYKGIGKPLSQRIVSPIHLIRYRDNWYLDALCHVTNKPRQFELSRIQVAKLTNQKAQKVPQHQVEDFYADSYGIFTGKADKVAVIRFSGIAANIVSKENWHPHQTCDYNPETETCILSIPYHDDRELVRDVLRWGELAEILKPHELREKITGIIKLTREKYLK